MATEDNESEKIEDGQDDTSHEELQTSKLPQLQKASTLKAFWSSIYVKIIIASLALITLIWIGLSTCSGPKMMLKKRYTIGMDPSWHPLSLQSREKNMTAFIESLLKRISKNLNVRIDVQKTSASSLFHDFENGKYDGITSAMLPPSIHTGAQFVISEPLYRFGPILVVNAKKPYASLDQMDGKIVGLVGDARYDIPIAKYSDVIFSGYSNPATAFAALDNQRVDGVIVNSLEAKNFVQGLYAGKFIIADIPLTNEGILLILHKKQDSENFIELFDQELKRLRENGSYADLLQLWHVDQE